MALGLAAGSALAITLVPVLSLQLALRTNLRPGGPSCGPWREALATSICAPVNSPLRLNLKVRLENLVSLGRRVTLSKLLGRQCHIRRPRELAALWAYGGGRVNAWRNDRIGFQLLPLLEVLPVLLAALAELLSFCGIHLLESQLAIRSLGQLIERLGHREIGPV